jgi:Cryptococcal mannosyltransferase 1
MFLSLPKIYLTSICAMDRVRPKHATNEELGLLDFLPPKILNDGKMEMKQHKVIICGLARDNAEELPTLIKYIEGTGSMFQDYRVIIFENDSKDGTKDILNDWVVHNNKTIVISKEYHNKKRPLSYGKEIEFLAMIRNQYLQEILDHPEIYPTDYDMLMVVDMDMKYGWDMRGIYDTFSHINKWDGVCSNGIYTARGSMYDMFAFRNDEFSTNLTHPLYHHVTKPMGQHFYDPRKVGLLPVRSCFGGMAFYKRQFVDNCQYRSIYGDCEHVLFHDCLTQNHGRMFMNTAQVIRYKHYSTTRFGSLNIDCSVPYKS